MITGLGLVACSKNSEVIKTELEIKKKSNITTPGGDPLDPDPGYTLALGGIRNCINLYFSQSAEFKGCIANIPLNTDKFKYKPSGLTITKPPGPPLTPIDIDSYYFTLPGTFADLIGDAIGKPTLITTSNPSPSTTLTTQDSVDLFISFYKDADFNIKDITPDPGPSGGLNNLTPEEKLARKILRNALNNAATQNIYLQANWVLYPSYGHKYILSYAHKTLKLPLRWKQYGLDFKGEYSNLL